VSKAAFLCGKIGYRRFLVRGCYNYHKKSCSQARWSDIRTFSELIWQTQILHDI